MSFLSRSRVPRLIAVALVAMIALAVIHLVRELSGGGADATAVARPAGDWFAGRVLTIGVLGVAIAVALVTLIEEVTDRF